jgi:hypothetical protein
MFQVPTHWMCGCAMQYPLHVWFAAGGGAVAFGVLLTAGGVALGGLVDGTDGPLPMHPANNSPIESNISKSFMG